MFSSGLPLIPTNRFIIHFIGSLNGGFNAVKIQIIFNIPLDITRKSINSLFLCVPANCKSVDGFIGLSITEFHDEKRFLGIIRPQEDLSPVKFSWRFFEFVIV